MDNRVYVLVNASLPHAQRAVQACHAAGTFAQRFPRYRAATGFLVLLECRDLPTMRAALRETGAPMIAFSDPDLGTYDTALAVASTPAVKRLTRRLTLLR